MKRVHQLQPQEEVEDCSLLDGAQEMDADEAEDLEVHIVSQHEEINPDDDESYVGVRAESRRLGRIISTEEPPEEDSDSDCSAGVERHPSPASTSS